MNTTNSPCSIKKPEGWDRLVRYLTHGEDLEASVAQEILWTFLENMKFENCDYHGAVVRSLFRRPNVTIPAVFYDYQGEGVSHFGSQTRANTPAFRMGDAMEIRFVHEESKKVNFEHGQGQEWKDEEWLCLHLNSGEWVVYSFQAHEDYDEKELKITIHTGALGDGTPELELQVDDKVAESKQVVGREWHDVDLVVPFPVKKGEHALRLKARGSLRIRHLSVTHDRQTRSRTGGGSWMKATIYTTLYENGVRKTNLQKKSFEEDRMNQELRIVNLYPQVTFQEFEGFGGAITEAVGVTLEKMPKAVVQEIMGTYFGPNGMGYRFIRTHLDSCDFSLSNYSALDDESDMDMKGFSLDRDQRNILPYIEAASARQGEKVPVMLTPWSPPPFMKTNGSKNGGGKLKLEHYSTWASYICRYIKEYQKKGILVTKNLESPWS
jgi:hypothetical protein